MDADDPRIDGMLHADEINWGPLDSSPPHSDVAPHSYRAEDLLMADIVALEDHVLSLQADVGTYRAMLGRCFEAIRGLVKQRNDAREQLHRVQDQYRRLREQVMRGE